MNQQLNHLIKADPALTLEQLLQQADVTCRLMTMATLGVPRLESNGTDQQILLSLAALAGAFMALAANAPDAAGSASRALLGMAHELQIIEERHLATAH